MQYVIGIDAGGTKTVGLLADETGQVVAEERGSGANLQTHGELEVEKVFDDIMEALAQGRTISAVGLGIAGVDRPHDEAVIRGILRRLGHRENARRQRRRHRAGGGSPGRRGHRRPGRNRLHLLRPGPGRKVRAFGRLRLPPRGRGLRILAGTPGPARDGARRGRTGPGDAHHADRLRSARGVVGERSRAARLREGAAQAPHRRPRRRGAARARRRRRGGGRPDRCRGARAGPGRACGRAPARPRRRTLPRRVGGGRVQGLPRDGGPARDTPRSARRPSRPAPGRARAGRLRLALDLLQS